METIRRRWHKIGDDSSAESSRDATPAGENRANNEEYRVLPAKQLEKIAKGKGKSGKRKQLWIFGLGGLFGVVLAAFFAQSNDIIDLKSMVDLDLSGIFDVLPAGLVKDAEALQVSIEVLLT